MGTKVPIERVVFISLVLDLLAFTIPLPLFPRIIQWYTVREIGSPNGFLSRTLRFVSFIRGLFYEPGIHSERWDVVLLGGLMGSAFSILQFVVSPHIGAFSDKYGRKRVLLITMIGNILSALVWIQSTSFASYFLSRVIGGLSEGNVQLTIAILSDITTPENRSKALAQVGISFAICFVIGPPIGAYFASRPVPTSVNRFGLELNTYAVPAIITLILLVVETIFLSVALPETRGKAPRSDVKTEGKSPVKSSSGSDGQQSVPTPKGTVEQRIALLGTLRKIHFFFLGIFSGVEFTLTFLTFDLFDWSNKQNGMLIGSIGIISAILQGAYVRRKAGKTGATMARQGVISCSIGLVLLAVLPHFVSTQLRIAVRLLQGSAVCMAFTSATVVNSLTACASLQCDDGVDENTGKPIEEHPQLTKGRALGEFRSSGQLGRAIGPLLACASYWTFGPSATYAAGSVAMLVLAGSMTSVAVNS